MALATSAARPQHQPTTEPATEMLAAYAAGLRYEDLPAAAVLRAKHCLIDALACALFGKRFAWSAIVIEEALTTGGGGPCRLPGLADGLHPPQAALVLGALSHAFEYDNLSKPGMGVHPGATVALPAFAMAQALDASGRDLLAAIVAGVEVMFRIGAASLHSPEKIGFHAPGMTGPFGAAAACASLMKLSPQQTANAFGIAGSLASGLLAFARAGSGGMVKRLHLGRAAEGGVMAARLAQRGYEGPRNVLEGRFGVLDAFCDERAPELLTKGLGQTYAFDRLCLKRYPCHVTAHVPVQLMRGFVEAHGFAGDHIREVVVEASPKVVSHHSDPEPADIMLAQYSTPFCVAISAYHDPLDPSVFCDATVADARVRNLAKRVQVTAAPDIKGWSARMRVMLHDGRMFEGGLDNWPGCPETPLTTEQLRNKFDRLCERESDGVRRALFDELMALEKLPSLRAATLA